ncbi:hypothetical protein ANN_16329 [Periplaneta americana]|uniref:Uncharacterized protein n=1 Tax=Periplaneta americana TaxID=6978 RepID=A0ABQ8SKM2_PERAM|nr:hypothetical protein ANN_16329 [Periplaneta americana]
MAGLCEGGNEPPGSLKARQVVCVSYTFPSASSSIVVIVVVNLQVHENAMLAEVSAEIRFCTWCKAAC